jgi:ubiquitin-protein ligase
MLISTSMSYLYLYTYHSTGKVCLSLINTWPGIPEEQWQPNKSTIMQVLLSIQSMILCSRPWFNEPGMGVAADTPQSLAYDRQIRCHTVLAAICDWATPYHQDGLWKVTKLFSSP